MPADPRKMPRFNVYKDLRLIARGVNAATKDAAVTIVSGYTKLPAHDMYAVSMAIYNGNREQHAA